MSSPGRVLLLRPLKERELLVKTFLRLGCEVVIADEPDSALFGMGDYQLPLTSVPAAAKAGDFSEIEAAVCAFHENLPLDGIITTLDYLLPVMGRLNERLGLGGLNEAAGLNCFDKGRQRAAFAADGVPSADFAEFTTLDEAAKTAVAIGYPVVVKPVDRTGSRGVRRVDNDNALAMAYQELYHEGWSGRFLIERYLEGRELSAEALTDDEGSRLILTIDKRIGPEPHFVEDGAVVPLMLDDATRSAVERVVFAGLEALGVRRAVTHTELRITDDGPRIIEVNGRVAGMCLADMVLDALGINLYQLQWDAMRSRGTTIAAKLHHYTAQRSLVEGQGRIRRIVVDGLAARATSDFAGLRMDVERGDTIGPVTDSNAVRGIVIARGGTPEQAFDAATKLSRCVRFECDLSEASS